MTDCGSLWHGQSWGLAHSRSLTEPNPPCPHPLFPVAPNELTDVTRAPSPVSSVMGRALLGPSLGGHGWLSTTVHGPPPLCFEGAKWHLFYQRSPWPRAVNSRSQEGLGL